jgi:uncharacterized membrane protein
VLGPAQRVVIASASAVAGGGKPNPAAAEAARRSGLVSRTNLAFSIPLLFFMGAASHYTLFSDEPGPGRLAAWAVLSLLAVAALEANSLSRGNGMTKKPFDSNLGAAIAGLALWIVLIVVIKAAL